MLLQDEHASSSQNALRDIRRVELAENLYFLLDIFNLILGTLQIDNFNGNGLLCPFIVPVPTFIRNPRRNAVWR